VFGSFLHPKVSSSLNENDFRTVQQCISATLLE
jgi:hypothetical protein